MNVKTETRPQPASPETLGSTNTAHGAKPTTAIDPKGQGRRAADGRRRSLWVAVAALASCAGVAAAVAIGASDDSSRADGVSPRVDVPGDRDIHREPVGPYGTDFPHELHWHR